MSRTSVLAAFLPAHAETLNAFLRASRTAALSKHFQRLHVVMGNEACDADSMVSSLVHAFVADEKKSTTPSASTVFLPVMSVNRDQFSLRCEVDSLFRAAHIDLDALVFQDEIDLAAVHASKQLDLTLTDHNKLKRGFASLDSSVVAIIDHHEDLGCHEHVSGPERNIAFVRNDKGGEVLAGSCCTLIAEGIPAPTPLAATLLIAIILLDNMNMDAKMKKGTPRDAAALAALEPLSLVPRQTLYDYLVFEKFNPANWDRFTFANCLAYDYKQFESTGVSYGCSSILVDLPTFWAKGGDIAFAALEAHRATQGLAFVVVQSMIQSGPRRQLLVYAPDAALHSALKAYVEGVDALQLTPASVDPRVHAYEQHNIALSRKQVVPLLDTFLKQHSSQL
ncbi:Aste57867_8546 [Aphanomyces stellatus]|uniref:Aste57867_8546 protein n=1 Tax=Aphanomyces stellatus TaxID=120398 RepID=A0A485KKL6_9STRA|nr:hypothetical protein As57867_008514 [Aphanomyces stellatus]VFT85432.1 Aste57867_8546 [Aphanomyces stellatus]